MMGEQKDILGFMPITTKSLLQRTVLRYLDIPDVASVVVDGGGRVSCFSSGHALEIEQNDAITEDAMIRLSHEVANLNSVAWFPDQGILTSRVYDGVSLHVNTMSSDPKNRFFVFRKRCANTFGLKDFGVTGEKESRIGRYIKQGKNIIVSGAPSAGKTCFLELLVNLYLKQEGVVSIEDSREIVYNSANNVLNLQAAEVYSKNREEQLERLRFGIAKQGQKSVVVGDIIDCDMASLYLDVVNRGKCIAAIHARSAKHVVSRLAGLCHLNTSRDSRLIEEIGMNIDVFIHIDVDDDGRRKANIETRDSLGLV